MLGDAQALAALATLSTCYENVGSETTIMRCAQAAMAGAKDADEVDLAHYRRLIDPYREMAYVRKRVRDFAVAALWIALLDRMA